jgi:hypothetical protein
MVGDQELVKPFVRFVGNGKLQIFIGGHHVVPNVSQKDWGRTVELFEVIKAGFTPFWFELRPLRIQRGETLLAKRKSSRLRAYYVTTPNTLPQKPGGNIKWYKYMVSTIPKPTNTRQNPTVKGSVPVELVPAKRKTTNALPAPIRKRRRPNDMKNPEPRNIEKQW